MGDLRKLRFGNTENVVPSGGGGGGAGLESITYAELKAKRDNGELTPGGQYRITDYVCTTTQEETRAVSHPFVVIVFADDEHTLNENARACEHAEEKTTIVVYDGELVVGAAGSMPFIMTQLDGINLPSLPSITVTYDGTEYILPKTMIQGSVGYGYLDSSNMPDLSTTPIFIVDNGYVLTPIGSTGTHTLKIEHESPGYYANCNLETWELKYSIDNDTNRFAWADAENGKGVIFYMKDDRGNECPYDFKQIQFSRYKITECEKVPSLVGQYTVHDYGGPITGIDEETPIWCYTFSSYNPEEETVEMFDGSVRPMSSEVSDSSFTHDNILGTRYEGNYGFSRYLNDNVFLNAFGYACCYNIIGDDCYYNTFGRDCCQNTLGGNCSLNTFGETCYANTLGNGCYENVFVKNCEGNMFGDKCGRNTLDKGCNSNTFEVLCAENTLYVNCRYNTFAYSCNNNNFGEHCENNVLGVNCKGNTFGSYCTDNAFGDYCDDNKLEDACSRVTLGHQCFKNTVGNSSATVRLGHYSRQNTIGNMCLVNAIGNSCQGNTIGKDCRNNTIGDYCDNNTMGDSCEANSLDVYCSNNTFGKGCSGNSLGKLCGDNRLGTYCNDNVLENNCDYINLGAGTIGAKKQYFHVLSGVQGTESSRVAIGGTNGNNYVTYVGKNSSGVLKTWVPADLAP